MGKLLPEVSDGHAGCPCRVVGWCPSLVDARLHPGGTAICTPLDPPQPNWPNAWPWNHSDRLRAFSRSAPGGLLRQSARLRFDGFVSITSPSTGKPAAIDAERDQPGWSRNSMLKSCFGGSVARSKMQPAVKHVVSQFFSSGVSDAMAGAAVSLGWAFGNPSGGHAIKLLPVSRSPAKPSRR